MTTPPASPAVAVIDIGSNSIKILVATRAPGGGLRVLLHRTINARISAGISQATPRLSAEGMSRGLDAVQSLLADARSFAPASLALVATSAVRDAQNGLEFRARVRAASGHDIRILTGEEEANLIGHGLTADPALAGLRDFYVFDLGGGSLECLAFRDRRIEQAVSLPLGCVRLTERFVADPSAPFSSTAAATVAAYTRATLESAGFRFSLPAGAAAVGTGGTVTAVRDIVAARTGQTFEQTEPVISVVHLQDQLAALGALPLAERRRVPGLPPERADVYPTALATILAVAAAGGFAEFRNSVYNLRYGLAASALETVA
jgi:exopolyphosphatase/guanosine-5'-triphosphate,3'-diphosphate pyrophosphatase